MPRTHDIFLSYNSKDREAVRQVHGALKSRNLNPWIDFEALRPGRLWQKEAEAGLKSCRAAAVFVGPSGIGPWENLEMRALLTRAAQEGLPLIPVLLPDAPKDVDVPLFLAEFTWISFRDGITDQEIARLAGAVPGKKKKTKAPPKSTQPGPPPLHNLPFRPLGDLFKGRDLELQALAKSLEANGKPSAILQSEAIHGLGGIGKTSLAVEYAWRFGSRYTAVLFVHAESPEALRTGLAALARADLLDLPERQAKDEDETGAAVRKWLKGNPDWLLILDNVDTEEAELAVIDLLPTLAGGYVLITSRRRDWPHGIHRQPLDKISRDEGRDFLLKRTEGQRRLAADDPVQAERLAERLDGLPLALEQAAAYINRTRLSLFGYLEAWEHDRERVMAWYDKAVMRYSFPVAMTWQKSFDQLKPTAATLLRLAAFLAPEPIPEEMFRQEKETVARATELLSAETGQEVDGSLIDEALADLEGYSLITRQGNTFIVHRVMQEVVQSRIPAERHRDWIAASLQTVSDYSPEQPSDVRTWPIWDLLRPHVKLIGILAEGVGIAEPTARIFNQLALLLQERCAYSEAEQLMRQAIRLGETFYGSNHPTVAVGVSNLAVLLKLTNRVSEAELLLRQALAIHESSYGLDHPIVARDLSNLAVLLRANNRLSEAEPLIRRALAIDEAFYGCEHPIVAIRLNNLARMLMATNHLAEAEPLISRALAINEAAYGSQHPTVANCLSGLALLLQAQNCLSKAESLMRRALAIDEAAYPNEHPQVASRLGSLAQLLQDTNRLSEAEPLMRRAVEIWERSLGPDHPKTKLGHWNLSRLFEEIAAQPSPPPPDHP